MENVIVGIILIVIVACIIRYLYKEKKNGAACIGCPHAKQCSGGCKHEHGTCSGGSKSGGCCH